MSPYTTSTSTKTQSQQPQQQQPQQTNRLFAYDSNGSHSLGQDRDYFMDPFASSAPSQSSFSLLSLSDDRLRIPQSSSSSHDPLVQLVGTSPFQQRPFLLNSVNSIHHSHSNSNSSSSSNSNRITQQQQPPQLHSIPESNNTLQYEDQEFFDDVNDFMLPSSLNDLLTPTELRKQQQFPSYLSSSNKSTSRQPSFEPMGTSSSLSSSWNVPFYNGNSHGPITNHSNYGYEDSLLDTPQQQPYFSNAINIPGGSSGNNSHGFSYHGYFSNSSTTAGNTTSTSAALTLDEDGPFIMEDTIESNTTTSTSINDNPKANNQNSTENYSFNHIIQQNL
jgi:hypothetical protein